MKSAPTLVRYALITLVAACVSFASTSSTAQSKKKTTSSATKKTAVRTVALKSASKTTSSKSKPSASTTQRAKTSTPTHESSSPSTHKVVVTRKLVHGRWVKTTHVVHTAPAGPTYQTHPDPDRYQQIQQALATNGYFKGTVDGKWGDDSVAAMKQFQADHKLPNDGRISALSLMGLGLAPNREAASVTEPSAPVMPSGQQEPSVHN